jgi:hypothetical protein
MSAHYELFTAGGFSGIPKHFDENSFPIRQWCHSLLPPSQVAGWPRGSCCTFSRRYFVVFDQQGDLGGELRMVRGAEVRVMPLSNAVQLQ